MMENSILNLDKKSIQISIAAVITVVGMIWAASSFVSRAEATDQQVKDLADQVTEMKSVNTNILIRLERIDTNVTNTQSDVTEIKKKVQ